VVKETEQNTWVQLTLTQGLYRQVRRMGEAVGAPVLKLIRVAFGDLTTDGLDEGQWRQLREDELGQLRDLVAPPRASKRRSGRGRGRPLRGDRGQG
jgi:23S rRNA pseudouridine2605 synthase